MSSVSSSRFSQLLASRSSSTPPPPVPVSPAVFLSKRTSLIYTDTALVKSRGKTVSVAAWAFLFSEIIQYTQSRVSGIGEFEKRFVPRPPLARR